MTIFVACPKRHCLLLLRSATLPVADQHMVRWPYTRTRAKTIDRLQRKMVGMCCRLVPLEDETVPEFALRRKRFASQLQEEMGAWSVRWARQVVRWYGHIQRDPNWSWPSQLLAVRSADELAERRAIWGRPRTRTNAGFLCARWVEAVQEATRVAPLPL